MNNDPESELDEREPFLFEFEFWRIVLDEAQNVRNKSTKSFKAVLAVDAVNSWCLTGTPIVNKPDDIQPYFQSKFPSRVHFCRCNASSKLTHFTFCYSLLNIQQFLVLNLSTTARLSSATSPI
jgi:SNF2-related domain